MSDVRVQRAIEIWASHCKMILSAKTMLLTTILGLVILIKMHGQAET